MIEDDEALEGIFRWDEAGPAVATRGAFGGGEGQSWNVGPIHVCSAKPGDILQARPAPHTLSSLASARCLRCLLQKAPPCAAQTLSQELCALAAPQAHVAAPGA